MAHTQENNTMELTIKYWSNSNPTTTVVNCIVKGYNGLKEKFNALLADRPDIDHVQVFWNSLQVAFWNRNGRA